MIEGALNTVTLNNMENMYICLKLCITWPIHYFTQSGLGQQHGLHRPMCFNIFLTDTIASKHNIASNNKTELKIVYSFSPAA